MGPAERVRAFSREDLENFVGEHYGPEQMVLAAAGAVDHDQLVQAATEAFGRSKDQRQNSSQLKAEFHRR